jgi:HTH-type transcriptional regulator / antitoxin HigA
MRRCNGGEAMATQITDLQTHWPPIASLFSLRTEEEYDAAVGRLNALVDEIGTNEAHPLYSLLDTLGTLVHTYEAEHHAIPSTSGSEVLQHLMRSSVNRSGIRSERCSCDIRFR